MRIIDFLKRFDSKVFIVLLLAPLLGFVMSAGLMKTGFRPPDIISYGASSIHDLDYHAVVNKDNSMTVDETWHLSFKDRGKDWHGVYKDFSIMDGSTLTGFKATDKNTGAALHTTATGVSPTMNDRHASSSNGDGRTDVNGNRTGRTTTREMIYFDHGFRHGDATITLHYTITAFASAIRDATLINWKPIDSTNTLPVRHIHGDITWAPSTASTKTNWIRAMTTTHDAPTVIRSDGLSFAMDGLPANTPLLILGLGPKGITTATPLDSLSATDVRGKRTPMDVNHDRYVALAVMAWLILLILVPFLTNRREWADEVYFRDIPRTSPGVASKVSAMLGWNPHDTYAEALLMSCVNKGAIDVDDEGVISLNMSKQDTLDHDEATFLAIIGNAMGDERHATMASLPGLIKYNTHRSRLGELDAHLAGQAGSYVNGRWATFLCYPMVLLLLALAAIPLMIGMVSSGNPLLIMMLVMAMLIMTGSVLSTRTSMMARCALFALLALMFIFGVGMTPWVGAITVYIAALSCYGIHVYPSGGHADDVAQLHGLYSYMRDFSDFSERGIPDVKLWEWYMTYAAAFGISKEVSAKLRRVFNEMPEDERRYYHSPMLGMYGIDHDGMRDDGRGYTPSLMSSPRYWDDLNSSFAPPSTGGVSSGTGGGGGSSSSGSSGGGGMGAF